MNTGAVYFNQSGGVTLPCFEKIEKRTGIVVDGIAIEIDLIGEYFLPIAQEEEEEEAEEAVPALGVWLVQVKYTKKRIREQTVRGFLAQITAMKTLGYATTTSWFFAM